MPLSEKTPPALAERLAHRLSFSTGGGWYRRGEDLLFLELIIFHFVTAPEFCDSI